ncbi:MAG TPA: hypothetical protein VF692_03610 [Pyrinomonadaceae bacterium]|jgi:hypothetical protein
MTPRKIFYDLKNRDAAADEYHQKDEDDDQKFVFVGELHKEKKDLSRKAFLRGRLWRIIGTLIAF